MNASTVTTRWCGSMASKHTARRNVVLPALWSPATIRFSPARNAATTNSPAADRHHAELDEVVHRDGEVAVAADRQQRLGGDPVAGVAAEHGEQPRPVGQLQVELRVAGVELDLVGAELAGGPADQVDQLVLVGGDRRPAHPLAADEGDKHLLSGR